MGIKFANNAKALLDGSITSTATSVTVDDGSVFPTIGASDYFYMTFEDSNGNVEIVKVTTVSTNTLTVVRAQDGTTARAFSSGDKAELRLNVAAIEDLFAAPVSSFDIFKYTATSSQTTFSGADDGGNTLAYDAGNILVTLNGVVLESGADYTASNGTSVVLSVAAVADDELNVYSFNIAGVATGMAAEDLSNLTTTAVNTSLIPDTDVTYDLGSSNYRWRDLYLSGSTIDLGGATISQDNNTGTIALVAAPTQSNPNPTALVVTSSGSTVAVSTTGGTVDFDDVATEIASNSGFDGAFSSLTGATNLQSFVSVFTLPTSDGSANQVLSTNGSGTLSFVDQSAGGGGVTTGKAIAMAIVFG